MSEVGAKPGAYRRLTSGERQLVEHPLLEGLSTLRRLLPQGRGHFEKRLARAMAEAARRDAGFYLGGFAARRALGGELLIDVNPAIVERRLDHRLWHDGRVYNIREMSLGAGDWTPLLDRLDRAAIHREVVEIVQSGFDYRATSSYRRALDHAQGPKPWRRYFVLLSSQAKVDAYFRQTAETCRSINEVGLIRRSDYGPRLSSFASLSVRSLWFELNEVDIGIAIGATGELYRFASGKHRTAAAQALKLRSMPVEIRLVHAKWLARQMAETGLSALDALRHGLDTVRMPQA